MRGSCLKLLLLQFIEQQWKEENGEIRHLEIEWWVNCEFILCTRQKKITH